MSDDRRMRRPNLRPLVLILVVVAIVGAINSRNERREERDRESRAAAAAASPVPTPGVVSVPRATPEQAPRSTTPARTLDSAAGLACDEFVRGAPEVRDGILDRGVWIDVVQGYARLSDDRRVVRAARRMAVAHQEWEDSLLGETPELEQSLRDAIVVFGNACG